MTLLKKVYLIHNCHEIHEKDNQNFIKLLDFDTYSFSGGDWSAEFSTERMAWAAIKDDILYSGVNPKDKFEQSL